PSSVEVLADESSAVVFRVAVCEPVDACFPGAWCQAKPRAATNAAALPAASHCFAAVARPRARMMRESPRPPFGFWRGGGTSGLMVPAATERPLRNSLRAV